MVHSLSCCLQAIFAVVSPGHVVPNLVAGAIAEAGAQQAGDMMQVTLLLTHHIHRPFLHAISIAS